MDVSSAPREPARDLRPALRSEYQAYICYSHADEDWAIWLQAAVEGFAIPRKLRGTSAARGVVPNRCGPVFRDRTESYADPDLRKLLHAALERSKYLIVICSPSSAESKWCNEEIRQFRASAGEGRIFCLIAGGDPNGMTTATRAYPPALFEPAADGSVPAVPLAADVRPGHDSRRDANLKIVAGMLGVGFDELRQRDRAARRRRLLARAAIACAFVVVLCSTYYLSLLDGQHPPGYKVAMRVLNDRHWILPAPVYGADDVSTAQTQLRGSIGSTLLRRGQATSWRYHAPPEPQAVLDTWTIGQALSGLFAWPQLDRAQRRMLIERALLQPARAGKPVERNGVRYGWHGYDTRILLDDTWPEEALWYVSALSRALAQPAAFTAPLRREALAALDYAQHTTDTYRDPRYGGWDGIADQTNKASISTYTTVTALQALLDGKRARIGWDGSTAQRDALIAATAARLVATMRPIGTATNKFAGFYGWRGSGGDENPFEEGVTLQSFAMLLRAEAEAGFVVPPNVIAAIPPHLGRIATASYSGIEGTVSATHFVENVTGSAPGQVRTRVRYIDFAWYPWAIACSQLWLDRAAAHPDTPDATSARRALGHLLVDLGPAAQSDASTHDWAAAELLVNLDLVPSDASRFRELGFK